MIMNSPSLPQTIDDVSVQLIISDGALPSSSRRDLLVQIYVAALPPFVLGVPSKQVQLYLTHKYLNKADDVWIRTQSDANSLAGKECRVLPDRYHEYFIDVYRRAAMGHENLPDCSLRFISGHGYGTSNIKDTHIKCGEKGEILRFAHMGGRAKVLTVLDICANPRVAACLADRVPSDLKKRKRGSAFVDLPFALACSKSGTSWCCRVGWDGQHAAQQDHLDFKPDEDDDKMSELLCFPVSNCILVAAKARCSGDNRNLDEIFQEKFQQLKTRYLNNEGVGDRSPPKTHTHLSRLQKLIDDRILQVNWNAFHCILYQRELEWFSTRELAIVLDCNGQGNAVAEEIVHFVIKSTIDWYSVDPKERFWDEVLDDSYAGYCSWETYKAWHKLLQMMGWFRFRLLQSYFAIDDDTILPCGDNEDESNVDLKELALCYPHLFEIVEKIQEWIEMGNAEHDWDSGGVDSIPGIVAAPSSGSCDSTSYS